MNAGKTNFYALRPRPLKHGSGQTGALSMAGKEIEVTSLCECAFQCTTVKTTTGQLGGAVTVIKSGGPIVTTMCGFSCIFDPREPETIGVRLAKMNKSVAHRGPDGDGVSVYGVVGFGHRRLAIIDLTVGGSQPMSFGNHHLTFNGEIYNFRELRDELIAAGYPFVTSSDTEVLLIGLAHWGIAILSRLKGMFAFAYYNQESGRIYLARDRFGKKPLVIARDGDAFLAASEAKQILAVRSARATLNLSTARRFLEHGELNGSSETFFEGLTEVPAGHFMEVDSSTGASQTVRWYDLASRVIQRNESYADACERVRQLFLDAVRKRLISDVPIGACLSGGIDSSSIVCAAATLFPDREMRTITSFAPGKGYDERLFSREIAKQYSLKSIEIQPDTGRIWNTDTLTEIAFYQEQPINSGSQYNEWCIFRAAKEAGLTVMLDGQGADEYFGGYGEFWFSAQLELLKQGNISDFFHGISARADSMATTRQIVLRRFARHLASRQVAATDKNWLRGSGSESQHLCDGRQPFGRLSLEELCRSSVPWQVHSEDRNSMRWSVESRLPFLDHDLVEYVLGLPSSYKVRKGRQKSILRDAMPELPPIIATRKDKIGFSSPDISALRAGAKEARNEVSRAADRLTSLVEPATVMEIFDRIVDGRQQYDAFIFRILSLDALIRAFDMSD